MKCKYFKEVEIIIGVNTNSQKLETFKICFNPITMVVKTGGVLLQNCIYRKEKDDECPYKCEEK